MAKYYYNKYTTTSSTVYRVSSFTEQPEGSGGISGNSSYTINQSEAKFVMSGTNVSSSSYAGYIYRTNYNSKILTRAQKRTSDGWFYYSWTATLMEQDSYSRGSLVQSNIIAEDGTYPTNGRHSDGYWYVRGSIYYDPPTIPSSITVPTPIKGGEQITISWGSSTYQTGYRLERSVDGGSWTQIVQQVGTSYTDAIVKGWNTVQYRVMAYGDGGDSGYRTSSTITVINFPEIFENINGTFVAFEGAWENVNGVWVEIDSIWENVNGTWVEL